MRKFWNIFYSQFVLVDKIGLYSYLRYRFALNGTKLKINIANHPITVRKGSPDLGVAISCLNGEFEILRTLLPSDYTGVIVDAGAYIGTATIALKTIFPNAKIVIIEPSSANLEILKLNVMGIENLEIIQGALTGMHDEIMQLYDRGTGAWGFTVVPSPEDAGYTTPLHTTRCYKLRDLVPNVAEIGLLKLDIEGGERSLLLNDSETLHKIGIVYAELHDKIIEGCVDHFFEFSRDRILIKDKGEKYLSIKK